MVRDTKLYDIFEVSPDANSATIKKAYNKLSKMWHPDRHVDPEKKKEATIKFQEINQAKDILLDDEKRRLYDQIGMDVINNGAGQEQSQANDPFAHFNNMFGGGFPFNFGGGFPGFHNVNVQHSFSVNTGNNASKRVVVEDIVENIDATLEQIINQDSIPLNYKQKVTCTKCNEEGTKDGTSTMCKTCDGKGMQVKIIRMGPMIQQIMHNCPACNSTGVFINEENKCDVCHGDCFIIKDKVIQVPLVPNVLFGQNAIFEGKGHQLKNQRTNLIVKVNELPHPIFKRHNNNLYVDVELKLFQTLFGFNKLITHLDGRKLHISCSGKTDINMVRKINNEGIVNAEGQKGDLFIRFISNLPNFNNLPSETKTQLKALLQSFDKSEVLNETNINKSTDTIKTICTDLKPEQSNKISLLLDTMKQSNNAENNSTAVSEAASANEGQCVHQ
jgi:DnaJ family protein A protein 2